MNTLRSLGVGKVRRSPYLLKQMSNQYSVFALDRERKMASREDPPTEGEPASVLSPSEFKVYNQYAERMDFFVGPIPDSVFLVRCDRLICETA